MLESFVGYQPTDVISALQGETPRAALFTTFTFSPGAFHQQYLAPLLQHGCPDTLVLADPMGYAQSLFESSAVQGIGTMYRIRQVTARGAFHAKLVLVRTGAGMIVGVGSGNLTTSGLQTNAEVGALYTIAEAGPLAQLDELAVRLRAMAAWDTTAPASVGPIQLTPSARLLTSLDVPLFDQIDFPGDVQQIEIVSPFMDGQLEVLQWLREFWPDVPIRLRLDPGFGALSESLLALADEKTEILVPVDGDEADERRRPAVHGKLLCLVGGESAIAIVGSANLSRQALLTTENLEAVVERSIPAASVAGLLDVPRVQWRTARATDRRSVTFKSAGTACGVLLATLNLRHLVLRWRSTSPLGGIVSLWRRGECVAQQNLIEVAIREGTCWAECEISEEAKGAVDGPTVVELRLPDGTCHQGWLDNADLLDIPPGAKRQLALLDEIADDPQGCRAEDVVRFIEWLQRNLSFTRGYSSAFGKQIGRTPIPLDDTPVERRLLLESVAGSFDDPGNLLARLVNRRLDNAIRDLRFFHREQSAAYSLRRAGRTTGNGSDPDEAITDERLPPRIETVLRELFTQAAEEFQQAKTPQEVARLVASIPTCLKGLTTAVEKWPRLRKEGPLAHFHRLVIVALAPGLASSLKQTGALQRLPLPAAVGNPEWRHGRALLEVYLLLALMAENTRPEVLRDMHDVLEAGPLPTVEELQIAMSEVWQLQHGSQEGQPDPLVLRGKMAQVQGELAGLRDCRQALRQWIDLVNVPTACRKQLEQLAQRASAGDPRKAQALLDLLGKKLQLAELPADEDACPICYTVLPVAIHSQLDDTTVVRRCGCGCLLVRALET